MKERYYNLDYMRAIACLAVVLTHVTHLYFFNYSDLSTDFLTFIVSDSFRILATFGVPCFVMISGALNLEYSSNINYIDFYKKSLIKLGIPTLLFIFLSVIYKFFYKHQEIETVIIQIIKGVPFDHLWYMYMLVGLYFITPLLKHLAHDLTDNQYCITAIIFCTLGLIVRYTCIIVWPVRFLEFLGYYLLGYYLKKRLLSRRDSPSFILLLGIIVLYAISMIIDVFRYKNHNFDIYMMGSHFITISLMSILIFSLFAVWNLKDNKLIRIISEHSFLIYLSHPIFIVIFKTMALRYSGLSLIFVVPVITALTMFFSIGFSFIYFKIMNVIQKR